MDASDTNLVQGSLQGSPHGSQLGQGIPMPSVPAGLPQVSLASQGGTPAGLTELVRMVATAATAAAEAAKAATGATQGNSAEKRKELFKLISQLSVLSPGDREQEVAQWRDWYWTLKQYLTVIDKKFEEDIAYVERSSSIESLRLT